MVASENNDFFKDEDDDFESGDIETENSKTESADADSSERVYGTSEVYTPQEAADILETDKKHLNYIRSKYAHVLPPISKTTGGHYRYSAESIDKLRMILQLEKSGVKEDIGNIMSDPSLQTIYGGTTDSQLAFLQKISILLTQHEAKQAELTREAVRAGAKEALIELYKKGELAKEISEAITTSGITPQLEEPKSKKTNSIDMNDIMEQLQELKKTSQDREKEFAEYRKQVELERAEKDNQKGFFSRLFGK